MNLKVYQDLETIKKDVAAVKEKVVEKVPEHFSKHDVVNAFFGALLVGLTFLFKGLLIQVGLNIPWDNIIIIITSTLLILSTQIYFISYRRVTNKKERPFGQFLRKRLVTIYGISLIVPFYLLYIFGFYTLVGSFSNFIKLTFILSMPCAIGAAVGDLLKRYQDY